MKDNSSESIEARRQRLLRELLGGDRTEPQAGLVELVAVLAMLLLAAAAVIEAKHGPRETYSVPVAATPAPEPAALTAETAAKDDPRLRGGNTSSGIQ